MATYLDTSALAKWYLNEPGSEAFSTWIGKQEDTHISSLTEVEFRCLLGRRRRNGDIPAELEQQLFAVFKTDVQAGHLIQHPIQDRHVVDAIALLERAPPAALRTLDALHLRIAIDIGAEALAAADQTMATAATDLGVHVVNFGI